MASIPHQHVPRWPARGAVRLLVVLDEQPELTRVLRLALSQSAYTLRIAVPGEEATAALAFWQPHLIVVDMAVAQATLHELMAGSGAGKARLPVIGLTHRDDLQSKLEAFEAGVDDVLSVPFAPEELLARVNALIRRSHAEAATFTHVVKVGELEIDTGNRTVRDGQSELHLTSLEQSLLYLLAANAGRVVSRDEILDELWGAGYAPESNVVDRQIGNLRARLHDDWKQPRYISTVPGRGYRLLQTPTRVSDQAQDG